MSVKNIAQYDMDKFDGELSIAQRENGARSQRSQRIRVLEFLGSKCVRCGFTDPRALQIDCVNGDHAMIRRQEVANIGYYSSYAFQKNILEGRIDRDTVQLLCANCNQIKKVENKEFRKRKKLVLELPRY
jgi:hypothetical protein